MSELGNKSSGDGEAISTAPAPWQLKGRGYIAAIKFDSAKLDDDSFVPAGLKGKRGKGKLAYLMLVDYSESPVGPYYELLFIPGRYQLANGLKRYSISRIFVSSQDSVINGRRNWGIPKDLADFDLQYDEKGGVDASISIDGQPICGLKFEKYSPNFPVTTALVPKGLRTLVQHWQGQQFEYTPAAGGWASLAKLTACWSDPKAMIDLSTAKPMFAVATSNFQMTFPTSHVTELTG